MCGHVIRPRSRLLDDDPPDERANVCFETSCGSRSLRGHGHQCVGDRHHRRPGTAGVGYQRRVCPVVCRRPAYVHGYGGIGESWTFTTDTTLIRASFAAISAYSSYPTAGFIDLLKGEITKQGDSSVDVIMEGPTFSCNTAGCSGAQVLNSPKDAFLTLDAGTYFLRITGSRLSENSSYGVVLAADAAVPTPPVPEPETYALLLAGLAAVSVVARRRLPK